MSQHWKIVVKSAGYWPLVGKTSGSRGRFTFTDLAAEALFSELRFRDEARARRILIRRISLTVEGGEKSPGGPDGRPPVGARGVAAKFELFFYPQKKRKIFDQRTWADEGSNASASAGAQQGP
jgi:hypothetical protein